MKNPSLIFAFLLISNSYSWSQSYTSYVTGDASDFVVDPTPGIILAGGATDNDDAMTWFLQRANGGDVLIIRASGSDGYNDYLYSELGVDVNSVESIVFDSEEASSDPYVLTQIANAEAIFMAGGDQWNYVNFWKDNAVEDALNNFIHIKGGVIGGTSAGMAVQGGHYFSAENGTVYSDEALEDPYNSYMTIGHQHFLSHQLLSHVITDSHYNDPDRRGRHMTFLARILQEGFEMATGIGSNEYVAVCVDENGLAHCFGEYPEFDDFAYFVRPNCIEPIGPEVCVAGESLTWIRNQSALKVYRAHANVDGSSTFDLNDWITSSGDGQWQDWWVDAGETHYVEDTSAPECSITTTFEMDNFSVKVFPNPATDVVHIESNQAIESIILWEPRGRKVIQEKSVNMGLDINVENLNPGLYLIEVKMHSGQRNIFRLAIQ